MRGTSSHDVVFDGVMVPADKVVGRRPWGEFGKPLTLAASCFAPLVAATYLGIAGGARDLAVARVDGRLSGAKGAAMSARVQRAVGAMDADLAVAWWAILGGADTLAADGPAPATLATVMIAKRAAVTAAGVGGRGGGRDAGRPGVLPQLPAGAGLARRPRRRLPPPHPRGDAGLRRPARPRRHRGLRVGGGRASRPGGVPGRDVASGGGRRRRTPAPTTVRA